MKNGSHTLLKKAVTMVLRSMLKLFLYPDSTMCWKNYRFCLSPNFANDVYSENRLQVYDSPKCRSRCQGFVKNAARTRAQEAVENIAEMSISTHEIQRPICGLRCFPSSKFNKTLKKCIKSLCVSNTAFLFPKSLSTETAAWKQCVDAKYQPYRPAERPLCTLDGGETWRDSYPKKRFHYI